MILTSFHDHRKMICLLANIDSWNSHSHSRLGSYRTQSQRVQSGWSRHQVKRSYRLLAPGPKAGQTPSLPSAGMGTQQEASANQYFRLPRVTTTTDSLSDCPNTTPEPLLYIVIRTSELPNLIAEPGQARPIVLFGLRGIGARPKVEKRDDACTL